MKNFKSFVLSLLVFMALSISLPIITHAEGEASVNLATDECTGGSSYYKNGVTSIRSFYLCYLLDKNGNKVEGTNAVLLKSSGASVLEDSVFKCTSRRGEYSASNIRGTAPWGVTPFNADGSSNAEVIRNWLKAKNLDPTGSKANAWIFVKGIFGTTYADRFGSDEIVLVVETVFNFQPSYFYTYNVDYDSLPSMIPESVRLQMVAKNGQTFHRPFGDSVVGTVPNLITYMQTNYSVQTSKFPYIDFLPLTSNNPFKSYTNGVMPQSEKIAYNLCGLPVYASSGLLTNSQVLLNGVGMLIVTAKDMPVPEVVEAEIPADGTCEGYIYTLSASANAGGTREVNLLQGALDLANPAQGSDAEALSNTLAGSGGASFFGNVAQVAYTGTSVGLKVESTSRIGTGLLSVDPSSFYGVTMTTASQSDYQSFADSVYSSIGVSIDLQMRDGGNIKGIYNYDTSSYNSSGFTSPSYESTNYSPWLTASGITYAMSRKNTPDVPTWVPSASYDSMCNKFKQVYFNSSTASGRDLFESTEVYEGYKASTEKYVAMLKSSGVLEAKWQANMEAERVFQSQKAGQKAKDLWTSKNAPPAYVKSPDELGLKKTDTGYASALSKRTAYEADMADYNALANGEYDSAYDSTFSAYVEQNYVIPIYRTDNAWSFNIYTTVPITESSYLLQDKIPLKSGPSASAGKRFQKGYIARWVYSMPFSWSGDTSHLITFIPFVNGASTQDMGTVTSIDKLFDTVHILNADFIVSDATSADMKN